LRRQCLLDEFAHRNTSINGQFTVAINWDTWQEVGMAVNTAVPDELKSGEKRALKMGFCPQKLLMPLAGS